MAKWGDIWHPSTWGKDLRDATNSLGITTPAPPDISKGPDAEALRNFAGQLKDEYTNRTAPGAVDRSQADQARDIQGGAIGTLRDVANGTTKTAADALLQKGTDQAARTAMGTAATYSAQNPGEALRLGLAAGTDAGNKAAADAALQKAQEQAAARAELVAAANQMRSGDLGQQGTELTQEQITDQDAQNRRMAAAGLITAPFSTSLANQQIQANNNAANSTIIGSIYGAGAKSLGSAVSGSGGSNGGGGSSGSDQSGDGLATPSSSYSAQVAPNGALTAARSFTGPPPPPPPAAASYSAPVTGGNLPTRPNPFAPVVPPPGAPPGVAQVLPGGNPAAPAARAFAPATGPASVDRTGRGHFAPPVDNRGWMAAPKAPGY